MGRKKYFVIGIDEAGRGPLAGPIAVAGVAAFLRAKKINFGNRGCGRAPRAKRGERDKRFSKFDFLSDIRDSKKLSAKQREKWAKILCEKFECHSTLIGPKIIDKIGISKAAKMAVARVLKKFGKEPDLVLLDGSLYAPKHYNQKTIIKGDEKVPLIAAASIIAKVRRDNYMLNLHKKFPRYCFDRHKGYATKLHFKMLKKHGPCPFHRHSFCK